MYLWERYLNCDHAWSAGEATRYQAVRYECSKCLTVRIGDE
jgi:hypothetical protein